MASGGDDESHHLDLSEINAELENLDKSSDSEHTDSLVWEECKADLVYEDIAKDSSILNDFRGFEPLTSTPTKSAHSSTAPTKPTRSKVKESPKGTKSAPVSPAVVKTHFKVKQRIQGWEK